MPDLVQLLPDLNVIENSNGTSSVRRIIPNFIGPVIGNCRGRELTWRNPTPSLTNLKKCIRFASQQSPKKQPSTMKYMKNPLPKHNEKGDNENERNRARKKESAKKKKIRKIGIVEATSSIWAQATITTTPSTMVLMVWNVWRLNKDEKIKEVKTLIEAKRVDIFRLNKTTIKCRMQSEVISKFGVEWEIHTNLTYTEEREGDSIWIGWNPEVWKGSIPLATRH